MFSPKSCHFKKWLLFFNEQTKLQLSVQCERLAHEGLQMQVEYRCKAEKTRSLEKVRAAKQSLIEQMNVLHKKLEGADERARVQQQLVVKVFFASEH